MRTVYRMIVGGLAAGVVIAGHVVAEEGEDGKRGKRQFGGEGGERRRFERGGEQMRGRGMEMVQKRMQQRMAQAMVGRMVTNPRIAEEIGLSEEQVEKLATAIEELKEEHHKFREELQGAAREQAELMTEPTIDEEAVMKAVEKTGDIRTQMAKLEVKQLLLVKKTLTPEQIEKVKELMKKYMEQRRARGGRDGEGKQGRWKRGRGKGDDARAGKFDRRKEDWEKRRKRELDADEGENGEQEEGEE